MALAPVVEDLIAIGEGNHPDPPTQQAGTMHFLNEYAGQVDRDHAELMPTETRIEYLKIRQATLETDQIKLRSMVKAKERKEKGDPEVAAKLPPMTSEVLEKMRNEVLRGLELVIMVRSSISKCAISTPVLSYCTHRESPAKALDSLTNEFVGTEMTLETRHLLTKSL